MNRRFRVPFLRTLSLRLYLFGFLRSWFFAFWIVSFRLYSKKKKNRAVFNSFIFPETGDKDGFRKYIYIRMASAVGHSEVFLGTRQQRVVPCTWGKQTSYQHAKRLLDAKA